MINLNFVKTWRERCAREEQVSELVKEAYAYYLSRRDIRYRGLEAPAEWDASEAEVINKLRTLRGQR